MNGPGSVVPIGSHRPEALRLALEFLREARVSPEAEWLAPSLEARIDALRTEDPMDGYLFVGPSDEAVGISLDGPDTEAGITVHPFLAEGFRTGASLAAFLHGIEQERYVRVVYEPLFGVPSSWAEAALASAGFRRIVRGDMVFPEDATIPTVPDDPSRPVRGLSAADAPALGRLMTRAYDDNPDDRLLFQRWRDPAEDARRALEAMLSDGLGTWRADASFGVDAPDGLAAAVLVHEFHGPLISEVMTDPAWRRRGLARRLLARSLGAVRDLGLGPPRLVLTHGNERAHALYRSMGFQDRPDLVGGVWIRGLPPGNGLASGA